jgi:hypothetical protein
MKKDAGKCVGCGETAGTAYFEVNGVRVILCDLCAEYLSATPTE